MFKYNTVRVCVHALNKYFQPHVHLLDGDMHKPVPGMALLPVLSSSSSIDDDKVTGMAPRPPSGAPPSKTSTGKLPSRK